MSWPVRTGLSGAGFDELLPVADGRQRPGLGVAVGSVPRSEAVVVVVAGREAVAGHDAAGGFARHVLVFIAPGMNGRKGTAIWSETGAMFGYWVWDEVSSE